ncbi:MAG: OmpH family outer membrane protein [Bacteroidales bacterium]|nr:OmpH family outer membrane protein [Bacteroidales bacterium]
MEEELRLNTEQESIEMEKPQVPVDKVEKKGNNVLLIIALIVACGALVMSIFAFCKKRTNITETKVKAEKVVQSGNLKIAYINTDTIMAKYTMAVEMQKELQAKQSSLESSLKNQYTQLQKEEQDYLKNGQNLTLTQQQAKEKEFQQREQQLSQAMQQQPLQFQQEVAKQNEKLLNAVLAFVKDYNSKHDKFNIILSNSRVNGPTLYIDEGMDITDEIVKGLNEEYENLKK